MSVNAVNVQKPVDKTGGAGKAIASAFIPGLGQFIDGRNKQGALYMGGSVACGIAGAAINGSLMKDAFEASKAAMKSKGTFDITKYLSKLSKGKLYGLVALGLASMALYIANIVDAAKGNKK